MFLNYRRREQEIFFEDTTIQDIKTWSDVKQIEDDVLYSIGMHRKEDNVELTEKEKEALASVLVFQTAHTKIEHLREYVVSQEKESEQDHTFTQGMLEETMIPLEKFPTATGNSVIEEAKHKNVPTFSSLYEYLATGKHLGNCGFTSNMFGVYYQDIFQNVECHKGILPKIAGSINAPRGNHAWIEAENHGQKYIIDTSLLVAIPIEYKEKMGYQDTAKPTMLKETIHYLQTTPYQMTSQEGDLLECVEYQSKSNQGKMSYSKYTAYKERLQEQIHNER